VVKGLTRKPCPSRKHSPPVKAIQDSGFSFNLKGFNMFSHNPRITCTDGFNISVQAHEGAYSQRNTDGVPVTVECGFPSTTPKTAELRSYAECFGDHDYTETVYGWVPVEVVQAELDAHGGILDGCLPS
tara:strand:+ start:321 stop:707 length:387 start_codon:yes stop_codon:yes gene_type:complete